MSQQSRVQEACKFEATVRAYRLLEPIQMPRGCTSKPPTRSA